MSDIQGSEDFQIPADANIQASDVGTPKADPTAPPVIDMDNDRAMWVKGMEANGEALPPEYSSFNEMFDVMRGLKDAPGQAGEVKTEGDVEVPAPTGEDIEVPENPDKLEVTDPDTMEAQIRNKMAIAEAWNKWGEELQSSMTLSDESRQSIKDLMGVPDAVIDAYITGFKAEQQKQFNEAAAIVGSQDKLTAVLQWASTTMSAEQRAAANSSLAGPNREIYLSGLVAQYDKANPTLTAKSQEPAPRKPGTPGVAAAPTQEIKPFSSEAERRMAVADYRYTHDAVYRQHVAARLAATYNQGR